MKYIGNIFYFQGYFTNTIGDILSLFCFLFYFIRIWNMLVCLQTNEKLMVSFSFENVKRSFYTLNVVEYSKKSANVV